MAIVDCLLPFNSCRLSSIITDIAAIVNVVNIASGRLSTTHLTLFMLSTLPLFLMIYLLLLLLFYVFNLTAINPVDNDL